MTDARIDIGARIAEIMKEQNISVRKLAEMTGYNIANISKICNGRYSVGIDVLSTILDALNKHIEIVDK
ncbi:MAG: helix-turn-helix transcriptional regulator [Bacteroidales bacterium]|nr:helix-turn-helix transcriptional regulator [Bacteroidales bacterium]